MGNNGIITPGQWSNGQRYNFKQPINLTGASVTSTTTTSSGNTGSAVKFDWSQLGGYISSTLEGIGSIIQSVAVGKAIKNGTYYNKYNQGYYNSYNSTGTVIFVVAGVVALVVLLKK